MAAASGAGDNVSIKDAITAAAAFIGCSEGCVAAVAARCWSAPMLLLLINLQPTTIGRTLRSRTEEDITFMPLAGFGCKRLPPRKSMFDHTVRSGYTVLWYSRRTSTLIRWLVGNGVQERP